MSAAEMKAMWRVVGGSIQGASHRRRGLPNQDAILWRTDSAGANLALAVADGHGSSACFRSGTGAELAVETAVSILLDFACRQGGADLVGAAKEWLPGMLVARWRAAVAVHLLEHPLTAAELEAVARRKEVPVWNIYGSTVLALLATGTRLLLLQLGDGDILMVSGDGAVTRPWPRDPRCLGVETTSLCGADAAADTRVMVAGITAESPALILLATDGYANSFREEEGFLRTGGDLLEIIRQDGIAKVEQNVEAWLNEASECGSGDDITVGLLCRTSGPEAEDGD